MAFSTETKENVLSVTEGVLETAVDLTIFCTLMGLDIFSLADKQKLYRPGIGDSDWIINTFEKVNYKTIKNALNNARKKGFVEKGGAGKTSSPKVTLAGKKRIKSKIPVYNSERSWDGVLYMITYDVPEDRRRDREAFRRELQAIGCGMLQKSVWITPYNLRSRLRDFTQENGIKGDIIVSSVGKDGSIGEDSVEDLIYRVYKLDKLNKEYKEYIIYYRELILYQVR